MPLSSELGIAEGSEEEFRRGNAAGTEEEFRRGNAAGTRAGIAEFAKDRQQDRSRGPELRTGAQHRRNKSDNQQPNKKGSERKKERTG